MNWYYASGGHQHGPVDVSRLQDLIRAGALNAGSLVWRDGMGDWQPISAVAELSMILAPPGPAGGPPAVPQPSPYHAPSAPPRMTTGGSEIPNYLWQSIVVTLLCCQIFGIIAIVFAAQVDGLRRSGDIAGARAASEKAKNWCLWGFISGIVVIGGYLILVIAANQ